MILAVRVKSRSFGIAFKETSRDGFQVEARHHSACETSIPERFAARMIVVKSAPNKNGREHKGSTKRLVILSAV